jgi:hypothetical protein
VLDLQHHGAKDSFAVDIFNNIPKFHSYKIATMLVKVNEDEGPVDSSGVWLKFRNYSGR